MTFQRLKRRMNRRFLLRAGLTGSILAGMLPVTALSVFTAFGSAARTEAGSSADRALARESTQDLALTGESIPETEEVSDWWEEEFGEPLPDQEDASEGTREQYPYETGEDTADSGETLIFEVSELPDGTGSVKVDTALLTGRKLILRIPRQIGKWEITAIEADGFSILRDSLAGLVLPETIRTIGEGAFRDCSSLRTVTFGRNLEDIGDYAFAGCSSLIRAGLRKGIVRIGAHAFDGCVSLAGVSFPEGLTEICDFAFQGCGMQNKIRLPATLQKIGTGAFAGSTAAEFIVNAANTVYESRDGMLLSRGDHALEAYPGGSSDRFCRISDDIVSIRPYAFFGAANLRILALPDSLKDIGEFAFSRSGIRRFRLSDKHAVYELIGGAIYRKRSGFTARTLIAYPPGRTEKIHLIPQDTRRILAGAFSGNPFLEKVFFPEGLVQIQRAAFAGCEALEEVRLPSTVFDMDEEAFAGCSALKEVSLSEELIWISEKTFAGCSSLENVVFREGLTAISREAFEGCSSLRRLRLPSTLQLIDTRAFGDCSALTYVRLPASIRWLSEDAFEGSDVFSEQQWKQALREAAKNRRNISETSAD